MISEETLPIEGTQLSFGKRMNGQVNLKASMFGLSSIYIDGVLDGVFSGKLLGNYASIHGGIVKYMLGFHKSSLSVIQNLIIARNYEYQWIYLHHKVVYYANYLLIDLLRNCVDFVLKKTEKPMKTGTEVSADNALKNMLCWNTMINHSDRSATYCDYSLDGQHFFRADDADIIALFHKCRMEADSNSKLGHQLQEYHSRKYKKSLWKSYAEYHIFFSDFTQDEKLKIFNILIENSSYHLLDQYGYLNESWEEEFNKCGLKNVVWVNGDSKLKEFKPDNTFILFKDCTLTYRTVCSANDIRPIEQLNLFYIYYDAVREDRQIDREGLRNFIHHQI